MQTIINTSEIKTIRDQARRSNKSIGFVATMGNLHQGHAALLQRSANENDITILSIFINPTQFNNLDDLTNYPRTMQEDTRLAEQINVDYIFMPDRETLYPDGYQYKISENHISQVLEGEHRPGHFDGVLTIVMKLLQIIQPQRAYFGEKDYQQYQLIKGMAHAFFLDAEVIGCKTIREPSGLAFSSRNNLLSKEARQHAAHLYRNLTSEQDPTTIQRQLTELGFEVEYILDHEQRRYAAVYLEKVRLIDNVPL